MIRCGPQGTLQLRGTSSELTRVLCVNVIGLQIQVIGESQRIDVKHYTVT